MKKIWKMRKNREAVSPVIATILMVAITVVLAAVLYVMVMGFGNTGSQTPTAAITATKVGATAEYRITLISISSQTVTAADVVIIPVGATCNNVWHIASGTHLGAGDYFFVNATAAGQVSLTLRHVPSSGAMATLTFTATV